MCLETPPVENDSNNDFKQFKSQEAKQARLHYTYTCTHAHALTAHWSTEIIKGYEVGGR